MEKFNSQRQGEIYIFGGAVLGGLLPITVVLSINALPPMVALSLSSFFAALYFGFLIVLKKRWRQLFNVQALKYIFLTTLIVGILVYVVYFFGLQYTSPGNASIISLSEVFFSFLLFHVYKKDFISKEHIAGALLMVVGALIVLYPNMQRVNAGDILVLLSAFVAPLGNFYAQKARRLVSTEIILFVRNFISGIVILILALALGNAFNFVSIGNSVAYLILNGVVFLGVSRTMWIEGIHRISITKATALSGLTPFFTLLFAWAVFKTPPTVWQSFSVIPMFLGVLLLGKDVSSHLVKN